MNPDAKAPVETKELPDARDLAPEKPQEQVVKTKLDRSQMSDFAKATGTALVLARSIDDALVILKHGLEGNRQQLRYDAEQSVRALMAQDRTYAMRLRNTYAKDGVTRTVPEQPPVTPEIVVICGSIRFTQEMMEKACELELSGKIVLSWRVVAQRDPKSHNVKLAVPGHYEEAKHKEMAELHKRKIEIADTIFVVNPKLKARDKRGYIGESTAGEILYAKLLKKRIESVEPIDFEHVTEIVNNAAAS